MDADFTEDSVSADEAAAVDAAAQTQSEAWQHESMPGHQWLTSQLLRQGEQPNAPGRHIVAARRMRRALRKAWCRARHPASPFSL